VIKLGAVAEIWRYPVKSLQGERLERASIGAAGIPGDRAWALRDEKAAEIRGAKRFPALLECAARALDEPAAGESLRAEIRLPDGSRFATDAPDASRRLSDYLGRAVALCALRPSTDAEHYLRARPEGDPIADLRAVLGLTPAEPLPDFSKWPRSLLRFATLPGTYFDAMPLHLLTTASLDAIAACAPGSRLDVRRFRPNLLVATEAATGFVERDWLGRTLRIGAATLRAEFPTPRCSMPTRAQGDLPADPQIMRAIVREGHNLGVYAAVVEPGEIRAGDPVELVD
jgi:hypothetical protein